MKLRIFHRILGAVDLSEHSDHVKSWAEGLAKEMGSKIDYVGVFPKFPNSYMTLLEWNQEFLNNINRAKTQMFRKMEELYGGEGVKLHELEGVPDETIVHFAEDRGVSLVIMGFRGAGRSRIPIGSTALGVIRKSSLNVLLTSGKFSPPRRVAVAHSFKPTDKSALLMASAVAKHFKATLYRVHVIDSVFYELIPEDLREELKFELGMELSKSIPGVETVPVVLDGDVPMELAHWAAKNNVDLVVFGAYPNRIGLAIQEFLMQTVNNVIVWRGL
ncbi:MAG: universal stress protein [Thermotogae bacterium]|nr:universal stress protein [Thermotogota bacterium]